LKKIAKIAQTTIPTANGIAVANERRNHRLPLLKLKAELQKFFAYVASATYAKRFLVYNPLNTEKRM